MVLQVLTLPFWTVTQSVWFFSAVQCSAVGVTGMEEVTFYVAT